MIFPEGSFYPPGCWGVKRFECELVWWRRPQAGTQNPENLLPLPCCVSWSKLLTLSGLVSQWRQRDRRLASISLFFLREGQPISGGRVLSQKDTCPFDLNAGPEECTSEPWALQTPQAEQGAHPAQHPVQWFLRIRREKMRGGPARAEASSPSALLRARPDRCLENEAGSWRWARVIC